LFCVSTVSGSSVGATLFLNYKKNVSAGLPVVRDYESSLKSFYTKDYVTSGALRLLFSSPISKLSGGAFFGDRNSQLIREEELGFKSSYFKNEGDKSIPYSHASPYPVVKINEKEFPFPLHFINSYNIDEKRKSVISPVNLKSNFIHEDLIDKFHVDKCLGSRNCEFLNYGEATILSQMFPIMSESAIVKGSRYYDGGVYDNSGISTIREIYKVLSAKRDEVAPERKIVVFYAKNGVDEDEGSDGTNSDALEERMSAPKNGLVQLSSAMLGSVFDASNRRHFKKLSSEMTALGDTFAINYFQNKDTINLNRWLSNSSCDTMMNNILGDIENMPKEIFQEKRALSPHEIKTSIYFNSGEHEISTSDSSKIVKLLTSLNPSEIHLQAFTDTTGNDLEYEKLLARNRYMKVEDFIKKCCGNSRSILADPSMINYGGSSLMEKQLSRKVEVKFMFYEPAKAYIAPPR